MRPNTTVRFLYPIIPSEICMIGSIVEVKWTEDDLEGTEGSAGKYINFLL